MSETPRAPGGEERLSLNIIARIHSEFPGKFGIPRQSGLVNELHSEIVFEPAYRQAGCVRGLEGFSHIWLIWGFHQTPAGVWSPTVRPPRLGGNRRQGVFASRSPFRPNPLGLSCVELIDIRLCPKLGPVLTVAGGDLADGTPIYDIKPYLPHLESHPQAKGGFAQENAGRRLQVDLPEELAASLDTRQQKALLGLLAQDPRPAYHQDPLRVYGMDFAGWQVKFRVRDGRLTVIALEPLED
ncbi:MAG: tRNA (N6-threonylcarbamoyladenosine(37)-N6)-methyltransferase TrmO [Firmicutes bacterium]|nr:tRNA (N6-threonylcarbamoyladenosine(37)-N6)-methyltransferase TrmO [Bacillota bacterium]